MELLALDVFSARPQTSSPRDQCTVTDSPPLAEIMAPRHDLQGGRRPGAGRKRQKQTSVCRSDLSKPRAFAGTGTPSKPTLAITVVYASMKRKGEALDQ